MTVKIVTKIFCIPASSATGNRDFTTEELDGLTPKGVIIRSHASGATGTALIETDDTTANDRFMVGVFDGANQGVVQAMMNGTGVSPGTFCASQHSSTLVVSIGDYFVSGGSLTCTASSLITNGVRLNVTSMGSGAAVFLHITFFAGDEVSFKCGNSTTSATSLTTGFQTEAAWFAMSGAISDAFLSPGAYGSDQRFLPSEGFACVNSLAAIQQYGITSVIDEAAPTPAKCYRAIHSTGVMSRISPTTPTLSTPCSITAIGATTITINTTGIGSVGPGSLPVAFVWAAVTTGGARTWRCSALSLDQTDTGTVAFTGFGFKPEMMWLLSSSHTTASGSVELTDAGWQSSYTDGGNEGGPDFSFASTSGANAFVSGRGRMSTQAYTGRTWSGGTPTYAASGFVSTWDDDGVTFGIDANSGAAESYLIPYLAMGDAPGSAPVTDDSEIAFAVGTARTATGIQTFTGAITSGVTPKGAWIIWARTTGDANTAGASWGMGFVGSDGSQRSIAFRMQDNVAAGSIARSIQQNDRCIDIINPNSTVSEGVASFDSFVPQGIRLNWTTAPSTGYVIKVVLIAGESVTSSARPIEYRNAMRYSAASGSANPSFAILCSDNSYAGTADTGDTAAFRTGFITNEATPDTLMSTYETLTSGTFGSRFLISDSAAYGRIGTTAHTAKFKANGLRLNHAENADLDVVAWLVSMPGVVSDARLISLTGSTGSQAITGLGFAPTHLISLLGLSNVDGTSQTSGPDCESVGWGFFNGISTQQCMTVAADAGQATTNTNTVETSDAWCEIYDGTGTLGFAATVTSVDADGFTVNKTSVTAGAILVPTLSLGTTITPTAATVRGWVL